MGKAIAFNLGADFLSGNNAGSIWANPFLACTNWSAGPYDAEGWPTSKVAGVGSACRIQLGLRMPWAAGTYKIRARGTGQLYVPLTGAGTFTFDGSYRQDMTFTLATAQNPGVILAEILASQAGDNLRDVEIMLPGHEFGEWLNHAWVADKIEAGYTAIRFMDALVINAKPVVTDNIARWDDPQRLGHGFSWALRGRLVEEMIPVLCNATGMDAWINTQHTCVEHFYDNLFNLIQNGGTFLGRSIPALAPGLKVYHEKSNEWWNGFPQNAQQHAWYLGRDAAIIAAYNAAHPSGGIGDIEHQAHIKCYFSEYFKAKFAGSGRVVKTCLMSQHGNPAFGVVEARHWGLPNLYDGVAGRKPDVIGCGIYADPFVPGQPFTGMPLAPVWDTYQTDPAAAITTLFSGEDQYFTDMGPLFTQYVTLAAQYGAEFAVYEWGDDTSCFTTPQYTPMIVAYHRDPRQQAHYTRIMGLFPDSGGPYLVYMDQQTIGAFGWAVDEELDQTPKGPKRLAIEAATSGNSITPPPATATSYTLSASPASGVVGTPATITATADAAVGGSDLVITLADSLASAISGPIGIPVGSTTGTATVNPSAAGTHAISASHSGGGFAGGDGSASFEATEAAPAPPTYLSFRMLFPIPATLFPDRVFVLPLAEGRDGDGGVLETFPIPGQVPVACRIQLNTTFARMAGEGEAGVTQAEVAFASDPGASKGTVLRRAADGLSIRALAPAKHRGGTVLYVVSGEVVQ